MLNIKEIALRIGEEADEYADAKLQSKGEFHPDWHTVRDEYFAEALIAEIAKQNEPVAWAIYITGDLCDVFQNKDFALLEFNRRNQLYPEPSRELRSLHTLPPTAEQIANETAEAIASFVDTTATYDTSKEIAGAIRSGAWKEFKK